MARAISGGMGMQDHDASGAGSEAGRQLPDQGQQSQAEAKYDFNLWGDWTSVGKAVVLVPLLVISAICLMFSLLPVFLVLWAIIPGHWLIPVAAYYVFGLLFFIPPVEEFMWSFLDRTAREPTIEEREKLMPAWEDVISKVGKGGERKYRLKVVNSSDLNAYAGGGRQVAVTQGALQHLSDSQLRGIVAHELGHHAGLHPVMSLAAYWILKPIVWAQRVSIWLLAISAIFTRVAQSSVVFFLAYIFVIVLRAVVYVLMAIVYVAQVIILWFGRRAEYQADETAVHLGFGPGLLSSLHVFQELEQQHEQHTHDSRLEEMLASTHPPTHKRIARVQKKMNAA